MKIAKVALVAALWAAFLLPAQAQWQVPDHSVPVGRGAGTGFKSVGPCASGVPIVGSGASADPQCLGSQSANTVYAGPSSGSAATPQFRPLQNADTPFPRLMSGLYWGPGSIAAQSCTSNTVPVANARPTLDSVSVIAPAATNLSLQVRGAVTSADVATLIVCNPTTGAISATAGVFTVIVQ